MKKKYKENESAKTVIGGKRTHTQGLFHHRKPGIYPVSRTWLILFPAQWLYRIQEDGHNYEFWRSPQQIFYNQTIMNLHNFFDFLFERYTLEVYANFTRK